MKSEAYKYKVCVRCMTYNHSSYIGSAIEGFLSQKTDFPFIIMLIDDCSNDGEQDIINNYIEQRFVVDQSFGGYYRETDYAHMVYARHSSNPNCYIIYISLKYNHFSVHKDKLPYLDQYRNASEYEAFCEGDDYWTDPLKLQKQADFLDAHPDYSFCCHRFNIYEQNTGRWLKEYAYDYYVSKADLEITPELYSSVWVTQPLTMMARMTSLNKIKEDMYNYTYWRDVHLFYHLLRVGRGLSLNMNMGVYRWHDGGIASSTTGITRYHTAFNIYKELLLKTGDVIFRRPFVKNTIRLLRYKPFSMESITLFKEVWSYSCGWREKADILISFITPLFIINKLSERYRKQYLSNQVI